MAGGISDRVRAAMERLDQAIDRLEARAAAEPSHQASADDNSANMVLAERLDRVIARIEASLAS